WLENSDSAVNTSRASIELMIGGAFAKGGRGRKCPSENTKPDPPPLFVPHQTWQGLALRADDKIRRDSTNTPPSGPAENDHCASHRIWNRMQLGSSI
ncbi:MAG TPA: hypothetical protein VFS02_21170, partial [Telluria sp.]|nr:hypothetical protein [Telluria sp.]